MKKTTMFLLALFSAVIMDAVIYGASKIDLLVNPWIADMEMKWWNFFTTKHYISWVIFNGMPGAGILLGIAGGLVFLIVLLAAWAEETKYR